MGEKPFKKNLLWKAFLDKRQQGGYNSPYLGGFGPGQAFPKGREAF